MKKNNERCSDKLVISILVSAAVDLSSIDMKTFMWRSKGLSYDTC